MPDLAGMADEFENAEPISGDEAHAAYLDNVEALLARWALIARQDAEIAATWLSRRKPKKGRRVPWRERVKLSRRTRAHGRHVGDALMQAVKQIRKWREVHEELAALHTEKDEEEADE
jgi:hypothetical protein